MPTIRLCAGHPGRRLLLGLRLRPLTGLVISHGVCPDCLQKLQEQLRRTNGRHELDFAVGHRGGAQGSESPQNRAAVAAAKLP